MGRKKRRSLLSTLNLISWTLAALIWGGVALWKYQPSPPAETYSSVELRETPADPLFITGSKILPPKPPAVEEPAQSKPMADERPVIALIIDDFGPAWNQKLVDGFINLPFEITISVIPGNRTSVKVAQSAVKAGKEVFIHLPLEPEERIALDERDMIMVGASGEQVRKIIDRVTDEIPEAVGINNHMGSKATADPKLMEFLANSVRRKRLRYVDSRTSERSQALGAMMREGVPAVGRDVFLDVRSDSASVAAQIHELASIAKRRGWAVGIGHVKQSTLAAVEAAFPLLEVEGFRFVGAGKLIDELGGEEGYKVAAKQ